MRIRDLIPGLKDRPREIMCGCGHNSKLNKKFKIGGEKVKFSIKYEPGRIPPFCLDCVSKMSITCPWCGRPIHVGDYVTLYTPTDPDFKIPEGAVVYSESPLQLVGCQRRDCADSGADYCGTWDVPGEVKRRLSALEIVMITGEPVIMEN